MRYEPGIYSGQLLGVRTGILPSVKKTPFIGINFKIINVAVNGVWTSVQQIQEREVKLYLSDAAWSYTTEKLKPLGFNGDFENPAFTETAATLECTINEGGYDNFDLYHEGGGNECDPLKTDIVKRFTAKYRSEQQNAATPGGSPSPAPTSPQPAPQPAYQGPPPEPESDIQGEDIPF